jgi:hypothetical protein
LLFMYWWAITPPSEEVSTSFWLRIHFYPQSWTLTFAKRGKLLPLTSEGFIIFARSEHCASP